MSLTKAGLRNVVQDKIKRGQPQTEVLTFGEQTTIDEIEEPGGDYAPAHNSPAPAIENAYTLLALFRYFFKSSLWPHATRPQENRSNLFKLPPLSDNHRQLCVSRKGSLRTHTVVW